MDRGTLPSGGYSIQGSARVAMAGNPFSDPEINDQIRVKILRLQAQSLEWDDNSAGRGFDDHIVETLVESLDAHAEAYLCKVDSEDLISQYVKYMRDVGAALIHNAEQRSFLSDPYSEDRLRQMAENSGEFILRKNSLTAVQQEAEIRDSVERIRLELRDEAVKWHQWHSQLGSRIETRFEARYRRWEADAIEHVKMGKGVGGWVRRLQKQLYPEAEVNPSMNMLPESHPWRNMLPVSRFTQTGGPIASPAQEQPASLPQSDAKPRLKAHDWEDIEMSFVGDHDVEIRIGGEVQTFNYKAIAGFENRHTGKPSQLWTMLRVFGSFPNGTMPDDARTGKNWEAIRKQIERTSEALRKHFGMTGDPFPYIRGTGYHARLKIRIAPDSSR